MEERSENNMQDAFRLSVAPMIDWTDRHCRAFHRLISGEAWLYTEMIVAQAIIHGDRARLLGRQGDGDRVVLQLGGADPEELAQAVRLATPWGYAEVNLNVGCPSDRVQSGCFGAVLMRDPPLVARCLAAMREAAAPGVDVTVKCRIGVDEQEPEAVLPGFVEAVAATGVTRIIIHARKAWLQGLSPRENREIPPLDHDLVHRMKARFPHLAIEINGGIASAEQARAHLARGLDGVMIGRAAYHQPFDILGGWDAYPPFADPLGVAEAMRPTIAAHLAAGGRLHQITRHMLGLFHARPGARLWKRLLSEAGPAGDLTTYDAALHAVEGAMTAAEQRAAG